jgi:hypothetical protein
MDEYKKAHYIVSKTMPHMQSHSSLLRYIRPFYFICLISACGSKGPKIDLRPYIAPDGAFNNKAYKEKLISKSGRLQDREIMADDMRMIYAKGIGAIYIGFNDARSSIEHKAFYLDTAIDGSKFTPFDK